MQKESAWTIVGSVGSEEEANVKDVGTPDVDGTLNAKGVGVVTLLRAGRVGALAGPPRRRSTGGCESEPKKLPGDRFKGTLGGAIVSVFRHGFVLSLLRLGTER